MCTTIYEASGIRGKVARDAANAKLADDATRSAGLTSMSYYSSRCAICMFTRRSSRRKFRS